MPIYRACPSAVHQRALPTDYTIINVEQLESFPDGAVVDLAAVLSHGLTSKVSNLLKVLGDGKLEKKLTVRAQKFQQERRREDQAGRRQPGRAGRERSREDRGRRRLIQDRRSTP
jgi:large subunit ribosomal protein L15